MRCKHCGKYKAKSVKLRCVSSECGEYFNEAVLCADCIVALQKQGLDRGIYVTCMEPLVYGGAYDIP
jgi:hypothetical protein